MDRLDEWAVQGRVATAAQRVREGLARLVADSEELSQAMAEAEQFGIRDVTPAAIGAEPAWGFAQ